MTKEPSEKAEPGVSGDLAVIGEGTPNPAFVSIQLLQGIYHELTGKSEDVSKSYSLPFQVELKDFEQLNHRVTQCCEQYAVCAQNLSIKLFYTNDTQETFSSFERFRAFNAGSTSSVESVLFSYNFLVVLPKVQKPQSYNLSIRVASPIAISKRLEETMPFDLPKVLRTMGARTAVVTVKYVDYVVARTLLDTVDRWAETLDQYSYHKAWQWIIAKAGWIPVLARYIGFATASVGLFWALPVLVPANATPEQLAKFLLGAGVVIFATYQLAHVLGRAAESSLYSWTPLAYVCLTSGDKKLIKESQGKNRSSLCFALLKGLASLAVSVGSKVAIAYWSAP